MQPYLQEDGDGMVGMVEKLCVDLLDNGDPICAMFGCSMRENDRGEFICV